MQYVILDSLLQATKIVFLPAINSNLVIKSTISYVHGFSKISLNFNFPASTSILFFILWHILHYFTYFPTFFVTPGVIECFGHWQFLFYFILFFWFYINFVFLFFSFLSDDEEACDMEVTWQVTWCDVISLEHSGRVWKITSGHIKTTWWPWVGNKADMRM